MRATTFTNAWQGVLELPEPGRSPSAIGYQEVGSQMFAFTGFHSSRPIGASAYPTFSPPAEDEDSYAEGVVGFDEETISFIIGATEVETGGGTGSKTNGRRIRWKRTAETMVFEDIEGLQQALVSEPFEIQTGEAVSSYAWFRIITPDSLSRWPKGGMFEIKLNLVSADSGKILAPLGQFLVKKGQIPKFRGRKSIVYEGRQTSAQLRVALRVLGGMRVKPSLVVYRQADAMPDDSLSTTPLPSSLARAGLPVSLPTEFAVHANYPNPFNPTTTIKFDLPENSTVTLIVYDVLGREVAELVSGTREAGYHSATWNASSVASGVYFARFTAKDASGNVRLNKVTKLLLTK